MNQQKEELGSGEDSTSTEDELRARQGSYFKKVVLYMKSLPHNHPDRTKFALEQAAIRMEKPFTSYLVDLQDHNWQEKIQLVTYGRNRFDY